MGTVTSKFILLTVKSIFLTGQRMQALDLMVTILLFGSISAKPEPNKYLIQTKDESGGVDTDYAKTDEEAIRKEVNCIDFTKDLGIGGVVMDEPQKFIFREKMSKPQCIERCKRMAACFTYTWHRVSGDCRHYPDDVNKCRKYNDVEYGVCSDGPEISTLPDKKRKRIFDALREFSGVNETLCKE